MKKYILAMIIGVVVILGMMFWHENTVNHYFENYEPHSKLIKETIVNTNDTDYTNQWCTYKKVYRKYNYSYGDSTYYSYDQGDSLYVVFYVNDIGDTVSIEYSHRINSKEPCH